MAPVMSPALASIASAVDCAEFTMHDEPGMVGRFRALGVAAYVAKSAAMGGLGGAIRGNPRQPRGTEETP